MSRRAATEGGFTLLEILIAMLILVGGMASVLALFSTAISIHRSAVDDTRSALVAEEVLHRIRVAWNETGDLERVRSLDLEDPTFRPYRVAAEVTPVPRGEGGGGGGLAVVVRVAWRRGRGERSARFESVVLRDAFGAALQSLKSSGARTPSGRPGSGQGG